MEEIGVSALIWSRHGRFDGRRRRGWAGWLKMERVNTLPGQRYLNKYKLCHKWLMTGTHMPLHGDIMKALGIQVYNDSMIF